jgi:hypothetical protein
VGRNQTQPSVHRPFPCTAVMAAAVAAAVAVVAVAVKLGAGHHILV